MFLKLKMAPKRKFVHIDLPPTTSISIAEVLNFEYYILFFADVKVMQVEELSNRFWPTCIVS